MKTQAKHISDEISVGQIMEIDPCELQRFEPGQEIRVWTDEGWVYGIVTADRSGITIKLPPDDCVRIAAPLARSVSE